MTQPKASSNSAKRKAEVIKYYPEAECLSVPTVNGKSYHEIWSQRTFLGKGKTSQNAWSAAYKNINY